VAVTLVGIDYEVLHGLLLLVEVVIRGAYAYAQDAAGGRVYRGAGIVGKAAAWAVNLVDTDYDHLPRRRVLRQL
jgi:hypothetical protein